MINKTATAAAPTRGTFKQHGSPERVLFFGNETEPSKRGVRVSVEIDGSSITFVTGGHLHMLSIGKTGKFWAAPLPTKAVKAAAPDATDAAADMTDRGAKAAATRAESTTSDETRKCSTCRKVKPIRAYPTTKRNADGVMGRGPTCRACRDA